MDELDVIKCYTENVEMSLVKVAKLYETTHYKIRKILEKYNISLRRKGGYIAGNIPHNKGKTFVIESQQYTDDLIDTGEYKKFSEVNMRLHVKRWLIKTKGRRCEICNNTEWRNSEIPLICDHIDGNHENKELSNFRLVCPNCDAQLPTYKSKNIGFGNKYARSYMKDYYRKRVLAEPTSTK